MKLINTSFKKSKINSKADSNKIKRNKRTLAEIKKKKKEQAERKREHDKEYRKAHREEINRRIREKNKELRENAFKKVAEAWKMPIECFNCGSKGSEIIDHMKLENLPGEKIYKKTGPSFYKQVLLSSDSEIKENYSILCTPCNLLKHSLVVKSFHSAPDKIKPLEKQSVSDYIYKKILLLFKFELIVPALKETFKRNGLNFNKEFDFFIETNQTKDIKANNNLIDSTLLKNKINSYSKEIEKIINKNNISKNNNSPKKLDELINFILSENINIYTHSGYWKILEKLYSLYDVSKMNIFVRDFALDLEDYLYKLNKDIETNKKRKLPIEDDITVLKYLISSLISIEPYSNEKNSIAEAIERRLIERKEALEKERLENFEKLSEEEKDRMKALENERQEIFVKRKNASVKSELLLNIIFENKINIYTDEGSNTIRKIFLNNPNKFGSIIEIKDGLLFILFKYEDSLNEANNNIYKYNINPIMIGNKYIEVKKEYVTFYKDINKKINLVKKLISIVEDSRFLLYNKWNDYYIKNKELIDNENSNYKKNIKIIWFIDMLNFIKINNININIESDFLKLITMIYNNKFISLSTIKKSLEEEIKMIKTDIHELKNENPGRGVGVIISGMSGINGVTIGLGSDIKYLQDLLYIINLVEISKQNNLI
ncbi:MAG: hypothetical protein QXF15_03870 [Candidatus Aenigmatarchaeota archaeon]